MSRICIPDHEYAERLEKCAAIVAKKGYDIFLVNSNEADYANVRYFTNYWPLFERAGVAIAPSGKAALLVSNLVEDGQLSEEDLSELMRMIRSKKEQKQ